MHSAGTHNQQMSGQHFHSALSEMELVMNYDFYEPVDSPVTSKRERTGEDVLVIKISAALRDTLSALNCIGKAKEHLSVILVFDSSSNREIKTQYAKAQVSMREAMRYSQVLCLRGELIDAVQTQLNLCFGWRSKEQAKVCAKVFGKQIYCG